MPGKVPERWEEYTPLRDPVPGTRFIAFKVPLEQGICNRVDPALCFTPSVLLEQLEDKGHKLGLIVDLTNTDRYYRSQEFISRGIDYMKIKTEGKQVPSRAVQKRFKSTVDEFLKKTPNQASLIGVHCTHGLNRTGYLICRYMIDEMGFKAKEAISAFNDARGYSIERENYIADLMGERSSVSPSRQENGSWRTDNRHYPRNDTYDQNHRSYANPPPPGSYYQGPGAYSQPYHRDGSYGDQWQHQHHSNHDRQDHRYPQDGYQYNQYNPNSWSRPHEDRGPQYPQTRGYSRENGSREYRNGQSNGRGNDRGSSSSYSRPARPDGGRYRDRDF